jgi:CHAT domain-containing protein/tetratricopeptide (TPR) repeat protein
MKCDYDSRPPVRSGKPVALALGVIMFLTGCAQQQAAMPTEYLVTGRNDAGDRCLAKPSDALAAGVSDSTLYIVQCGQWQRISARLFHMPASAPKAMDQWKAYLRATLDCDFTAKKPVDAGPELSASLHGCTMRGDNWPYETLVVTTKDGLFLADAQEGMVKPLTTLIRHVARIEPISEKGSFVDMTRILLAEASNETAGSSGGQGTQRNAYLQLMQSGYDFMSVERYAEAEGAFRSALDKYKAANSEGKSATDPDNYQDYPVGILDRALALSLSLSNQGKIAEANYILSRAEPVIARGERPLITALYRAMLAANQGNAEQVTAHIAVAENHYRQAQDNLNKRRDVTGSKINEGLSQLGHGRDQLPMTVSLTATDAIDEQKQLERNMQTVRYLKAEWMRRQALRTGKSGRTSAVLTDASAALEIPKDVVNAVADFQEIMGLTARTKGLLLLAGAKSGTGGEAKGDSDAVRELDKATGLFHSLVGEERPYVVTLLRRGKAHLENGERDKALKDFSEGVRVLRETGQTVHYELIEPYLDALEQERAARPRDKDAIALTMLEATQVTLDTGTAKSIGAAAARQLVSDTAKTEWRKMSDLEANKLIRARDLAALSRRPPSERSQEQEVLITEQIRMLDEQLIKVKAALQLLAPGYFKLQEPVDLTKLQGIIKEQEAAALFYTGIDQTYGFLVRRDHVEVWRTDAGTDEITDAVKAIRDSVNADFGGLDAFNVPAARLLYSYLFGTAAQGGNGGDRFKGVEDLLVVVNGPLNELPMGLLIYDEPNLPGDTDGSYTTEQMKHIPWLLRKVSVTHFPSLQVLGQTRLSNQQRDPAPLPYIGLGNPTRPTEQQILALGANCQQDQDTIRGLAELTGTTREINTVARTLGAPASAINIGSAFTRDKVEDDKLVNYRVIHFATHATLPGDLPCINQPAIQISTPPDRKSAKDGLLLLESVEKLKLNADLVVLSACNTAGKATTTEEGRNLNEGLSGLSRGFLYAGAKGIVISHWPARDFVAPDIMKAMFEALPSKGAARALQQAQMAILDAAGTGNIPELMAHPYAWAVFAVVGDGPKASPTVN